MTMEYVIDPDKISIITPFYNPGSYFKDCIQSVLEQTYQNWELLLVNDHSTDDSLTTAKAFTNLDDRIKLFENSTKGLIPALRLAYGKSTGNYITRMDADDLMTPNRLEFMVSKLSSAGSDHVCVGKVKYISESEMGDGYQKYEAWLNDLSEREANFEGIYRECSIPSPNFLIHRADFDKIGGFESNIYPEDYDLAFRMYQNDLRVCSVNEVTHYWRDHSTRSTRTQDHYHPLSFIPLKVKYFLELDYSKTHPLVLWGAGKKGKLIAKELINHDVDFQWITDNENKIDQEIYGKILIGTVNLNFSASQVILAVSNPKELLEIQQRFKKEYNCALYSFF